MFHAKPLTELLPDPEFFKQPTKNLPCVIYLIVQRDSAMKLRRFIIKKALGL